jgi:hypothetical protein
VSLDRGYPTETHLQEGPTDADRFQLIESLTRASFPVALWSGELMRFLWANSSFQRLLGESPPELDAVGMPKRGFLSDTDSAMHMQDAAYTGLSFTEPEYEYRAPGGELSYWQITYLALPARFARPFDVLVTATNVTAKATAARRDREERSELERSMGLIESTLLSSLDEEEILQRILIEATESFDADWGWVAGRDGDRWTFRAVHGWPHEVIGKPFREEDLSLPKLAVDAAEVVVEGAYDSEDPRARQLMTRHDLGGFVLVPLVSRGDITGVMGFCWGREVSLSDAHRALGEKLAVTISLALDNAREYADERRIRKTLQSAYFTVPECIDGLEIGHLYYSASPGAMVGGDFYDVLPLPDERVGVVIGDVSGHGLDAAALASLVKSSVRAEAIRSDAPDRVVASTNELMLMGCEPDSFASVFVGAVDHATRSLEYCSAGHPAPVLVRGDEEPVLLNGPQTVMGATNATRYATKATEFESGDLLVMYTDGLTEVRDATGDPYGQDCLLEAVRSLAYEPVERIPESLFGTAFSYSEGNLKDDVAILAIRAR